MNLLGFVCHQKSERCFVYQGKRMNICSRCFGLYLFSFVGLVLGFSVSPVYLTKIFLLKLTLIFTLPFFIDGFTQFIGLRESNNLLRFVTGSLAGFICGVDLYYLIFP